jgi:hypothetical protein
LRQAVKFAVIFLRNRKAGAHASASMMKTLNLLLKNEEKDSRPLSVASFVQKKNKSFNAQR